MTAPWLLGAAAPIAAVALLLSATRWERGPRPGARLQLAALAVGLGIGIGSCVYFLALAVCGGGLACVLPLDALLLGGAAALAWRRRAPRPPAPAPQPLAGLDYALVAAELLAALAAVAAFAVNTLAEPHGQWDAWAIWNQRARWLFRAGADWTAAFADDTIHGDYPLLLPGAVARAWAYAGADLVAVPAALAAAYGVALVILLFASVRLARGRDQALLASLTLLGTPVFMRTAGFQYADIPVAFAMLASLALLAARDRDANCAPGALAWAGCAAGLAAWTKNEGLMFVACLAAVRGLPALVRREPLRPAAWFVAGLLPVAAIILLFKLTLAPPAYQFADQRAADLLARLTDVSRYAAIARALGPALLRELGLPLIAAVAYGVVLGRTSDRAARRAAGATARVVAAVAVGYIGAYLTTPADLAWQLAHSLDRLLLQLWPAALLAFFLYTASPSELLQRSAGVTPSAGSAASAPSPARRGRARAAGGRAAPPR